MTYIFDDPANFKNQVIDGFAAAYARYVERVPNAAGFVRSNGPIAGKVSLVVGGGSGHYPSYAGIVGRGFADGCVMGDVFTSPSTEQIYRISKAANGGAGVLLSFGNYAGDRLNFAAAQERLIAEGIDTKIVYVTDDIASAKPDEKDLRRGIAGTFAVYKCGGAAADAGKSLEEVARIMQLANDRTYSFGVAFEGCTFPGQKEPLFHVEPGRMEFGLGIHGEPGVKSTDWMPAKDLAKNLVDAILAERPADNSKRAAVILNGLGATKYEELFLLYSHVSVLLEAEGITVVLPEIGELVTSLDMAGCSLSVMWLDPTLEELWSSPADTASFRRGNVAPSKAPHKRIEAAAGTTSTEPILASEHSHRAAVVAREALIAMEKVLVSNEDHLGKLDAIAGDGDHGVGMVRGIHAAVAEAKANTGGVGHVMVAAGNAFGDRAGGTSGILWGIFISAIGNALGNTEKVDAEKLYGALELATETLVNKSKAKLGDKTMLDTLLPFIDSLDEELGNGKNMAEAWKHASEIAQKCADATAALSPKIGRARPLAERSVGTPDPGAVSMALIIKVVGDVISKADCGSQSVKVN
ncbi:D-erythrulose kinase [Actinomycetes bacterium]|nr:D-erythrulose kinase [Actinomycetes bacterium]